MSRAHALLAAILATTLLAALWPAEARAVDRSFAGSVQIDEHFAPPLDPSTNARSQVFEGFTTELSAKVAADLSDHVSVNVKICYGCHGFEADMAYFDLRVADGAELPRGSFLAELRRLQSAPRSREPQASGQAIAVRHGPDAPNAGLEPRRPAEPLSGQRRGDQRHALVRGQGPDRVCRATPSAEFKGDQTALDLDFVQSRTGTFYYVDNNNTPAGGAPPRDDGQAHAEHRPHVRRERDGGHVRPRQQVHLHDLRGGRLALRVGRTHLRAEWLMRRETFDTGNAAAFKYVVPMKGGDFFVKHGAYASSSSSPWVAASTASCASTG